MIQRVAVRAPSLVRRHDFAGPTLENLEPRRLWAAAAPQEILFEDVGVGGSEFFNVSEPLYVSVAPFHAEADIDNPATYDDVYDQTSGPLRTQIRMEEADPFSGPLDVFGMPVIAGKVWTFDVRPLNTEDIFEFGYARSYAYDPGTPYQPATRDTDPGIVPTNLHVNLSYGDFGRFTSVDPVGAPKPALAPNPFIGPSPTRSPSDPPDDTPGVTVAYAGRSFTGSFLLDTGGQVSLLAQDTAAALGVEYAPDTYGTEEAELLDSNGNRLPGQFVMEIGGIGGSTFVAGFYLDSTTVPTAEGTPIRYLSDPVLVLDIGLADPVTGEELTLDGIFGLNHLVTSFDPTTFNINAGPFDFLTFDEPAGVLGVNIPGLVPPPAGTPIEIEGVQLVAGEFLRTNALIRWTADGEPIVAEAGGFESFNISGIFDTGASGVLLSLETAEGLGILPATFAPPENGVVARHLFYNDSAFDGRAAAANEADDGAIATDKAVLLPGEAATFENVSPFAQGLNGIMVDIAGLPDGVTLTATDFAFRTGTTADPSAWAAAPAPDEISVRRGGGEGGSDRVTMTWRDQAVKNAWLGVTVQANERTGLADADVFYAGSLIGETGDAAGPTAGWRVSALDLSAAKRALNSTSAVTGQFDFDRDGRVSALDLAAVKRNLNRTLGPLGVPAALSSAALAVPLFPASSTLPALMREDDESSAVDRLLVPAGA